MKDLTVSGPVAGDRAPDAQGLWRQGVGFPLRLFDILRGTQHVLISYLPGAETAGKLAALSAWAQQLPSHLIPYLRVVAISKESTADHPNVALFHDRGGAFSKAYGERSACFLVRPDGYLAWRGLFPRDAGLSAFLDRMFTR